MSAKRASTFTLLGREPSRDTLEPEFVTARKANRILRDDPTAGNIGPISLVADPTSFAVHQVSSRDDGELSQDVMSHHLRLLQLVGIWTRV